MAHFGHHKKKQREGRGRESTPLVILWRNPGNPPIPEWVGFFALLKIFALVAHKNFTFETKAPRMLHKGWSYFLWGVHFNPPGEVLLPHCSPQKIS